MSLVKWAFIGLLLLPAAEIGIVILVALMIGWLWTIVLFLATTAAGVILLRRSGRSDLDRARAAFAKDGFRAVHLEMPGFGPIARWNSPCLSGVYNGFAGPGAARPVVSALGQRPLGKAARQRRRSRPGEVTVIDLEPNEWQQITDARPKKRVKDRPTNAPKNPPAPRRPKSEGGA